MAKQERRLQANDAETTVNKVNLISIGELTSEYNRSDVSFQKWRQQIELVCNTYNIAENAIKIMISSKLKGRALDWFHSKSNHIVIPYNELMQQLEHMFAHRPSRLTLHR